MKRVSVLDLFPRLVKEMTLVLLILRIDLKYLECSEYLDIGMMNTIHVQKVTLKALMSELVHETFPSDLSSKQHETLRNEMWFLHYYLDSIMCMVIPASVSQYSLRTLNLGLSIEWCEKFLTALGYAFPETDEEEP
jgi:hypothetical protein